MQETTPEAAMLMWNFQMVELRAQHIASVTRIMVFLVCVVIEFAQEFLIKIWWVRWMFVRRTPIDVRKFVYEGMRGTITEGHAMKIDTQHYNLTNIAGGYSQYGAPVVKEDGRLVGICCSFEHNLKARNIVSVVDSIDRSHNRNFMSLARTLRHLHSII